MKDRKRVLLAPIDPVHDIGLKMVGRSLSEAGHEIILLAPDLPLEEIVQTALDKHVDVVLLSRTVGYGVAELLSRFNDLADAAGLRDQVKIGIGGMAIRPELAQELGFDAGFGPGTTMEESLAFVEGRPYEKDVRLTQKQRPCVAQGHSYEYLNDRIRGLLEVIASRIAAWAEERTSPGVERARVRDELWDMDKWRSGEKMAEFEAAYAPLCEALVRSYYQKGVLHPKTRRFTAEEADSLNTFLTRTALFMNTPRIQHTLEKPIIFNQYGTGCPIMDITHIKVSEAWGADGVVHFDPSWGARTEGLFDGFITHSEDGTVITPDNLFHIHRSLEPSTLWQVRAHRGLNTPETVVLAGKIGAHMTKINFCYGSLGAGTDPERLTVDAYYAMKYAKKYDLPFDVVTNEELCGVPAYKAFAGMLIVAQLARSLGCRPVLQPLFCYSPEVMISKQMEDNYIDFNAAKIIALRSIIDAPIWPGAPIAFLTQTEDRVQSSAATAFHASLSAMLGVDAISIASSDEAYSGGPITVSSKVDTLRAVAEGFRFHGRSKFMPSETATRWAEDIVRGIESVLASVAEKGNFVSALYEGILGSREDGAYPGRAGAHTVSKRST